MVTKSNVDIHWDERAVTEKDHVKVNIADTTQRQLEINFLMPHLSKQDAVLEVGCGNGFLTNCIREHVTHVDAFDYASNMISGAKKIYGEKNNSFFEDSIVNPQFINKQYDVVICVRVLINLQNLQEQKQALLNLISFVKTGGKLILIEGFSDGFEAIDMLRKKVGLSSLKPASINFYSKLSEFMPMLEKEFILKNDFHSGCFDFLTRVVYPMLAGEENATGHSDFHEKIYPIANVYNLDAMKDLARLRGFVLEKKIL